MQKTTLPRTEVLAAVPCVGPRLAHARPSIAATVLTTLDADAKSIEVLAVVPCVGPRLTHARPTRAAAVLTT
eukprot:SAG31_NODE_30027_length_386_cov_0.986063_1_plen_71_part_01